MMLHSVLCCSECPFKGKLCPVWADQRRHHTGPLAKISKKDKLCLPAKVAMLFAETLSENVFGAKSVEEIMDQAIEMVKGKKGIKVDKD